MNKKNIVDESYDTLMSKLNQGKIDKSKDELNQNIILNKKNDVLLDIAKFLARVRDSGLMVDTFEVQFKSETDRKKTPPTNFTFFQKKSTTEEKYDLIHPSPILVIRDPTPIEIGVVNSTYVDKNGLIMIKCNKAHPDNIILNQRFDNSEQALKALTDFLIKNAAINPIKE